MMKAKMGYHAERQDQLARNVANVDTPGYKAHDLKDLDFQRMAHIESSRLNVRATNSKHITDTRKDMTDFRSEKVRKTYEMTPMENNIVLEEQMMKIAENQMEYQKVMGLYTKATSLFKTAIGNQ